MFDTASARPSPLKIAALALLVLIGLPIVAAIFLARLAMDRR